MFSICNSDVNKNYGKNKTKSKPFQDKMASVQGCSKTPKS